jgi:hypothetical protein
MLHAPHEPHEQSPHVHGKHCYYSYDLSSDHLSPFMLPSHVAEVCGKISKLTVQHQSVAHSAGFASIRVH